MNDINVSKILKEIKANLKDRSDSSQVVYLVIEPFQKSGHDGVNGYAGTAGKVYESNHSGFGEMAADIATSRIKPLCSSLMDTIIRDVIESGVKALRGKE